MQWLDEHGDEVQLAAPQRTPKTFIPREVYSRYLKSTLQREAEQSKTVDFQELHDEAIDACLLDDKKVEVRLPLGPHKVCFSSSTAKTLHLLCLSLGAVRIPSKTVWPSI